MKDLGINRISPSGLMAYQKCPRLFYYTVWLGLKLPQSFVHLDFGTAIHAAVDVLYEGRNSNGTWDDDKSAYRALDVFREKFMRTSCDSDEQYTTMLDDGIEILRQYWGQKEVLLAKGVNPIEFEVPGKDIMLNPHTKEPLPIPMSYRLDAILADHGVGEFKTSSSAYDPFECRARPQSLCYVWVYYQKYGVIPTLHYIVMRKKLKKNKIQHLKFVYDMADILAFDAEVRATLKRIANREFNRPVKGHYMCDCDKYSEALAY